MPRKKKKKKKKDKEKNKKKKTVKRFNAAQKVRTDAPHAPARL